MQPNSDQSVDTDFKKNQASAGGAREVEKNKLPAAKQLR